MSRSARACGLGVAVAGLALLCTSDAARAGEAAGPSAAYQALARDYDAALQAFQKASAAAKTDAERQKAAQSRPQVDKYAAQFAELASKDPKGPDGLEASLWLATRAANTPPAAKALDLLLQNHLASPRLADLCASLIYSTQPAAEKVLRALREQSPHRAVQGKALFALAQRVKRRGGEDAERMFAEVIEKYGDVPGAGGTLATAAEKHLFEAQHLAIGKVAPRDRGPGRQRHEVQAERVSRQSGRA